MDIAEIQAAIAAKAPGSWIAAETAVWLARSEVVGDAGLGFGLNTGPSPQALVGAADGTFDDLALPPPPASFDWRNSDGGRVTRVKDQGHCGSCVAFAICATMESTHWIAANAAMDLSESHLFYCGGATCANGWDFVPALEVARSQGVGLAANLPYDPSGSCVQITPKLRIATYKHYATPSGRKRAIGRAPVVAGMAVYQDFIAYRGGVYRHVLGATKRYHAVSVVGYDDTDQCWVAKNSWGPGFGEAGFFKIAYGECEMEDFPFYALEVEAC